MQTTDIRQQSIDTLRLLSVDMIERAGSGHPGMALGAAPMAFLLFTAFLKHNPENPEWPDRDRIILSAGHASALLYSLLHLSGYNLPLEQLKRFRQWGSRTPGHPEQSLTPGVEATTGPLGQGISMAVGMAIAERHLAAHLNTPEMPLINHRTYAICSDGDLMEGVSSETASLAGHLRLDRLVCLYDCNSVSIEGPTTITFTENVAERYRAYGWDVSEIEDANDLDALEDAISKARDNTQAPSLIIVHSHIGYGSPNRQDTAAAHGSPLGSKEVVLLKQRLGFPPEKEFVIPEAVRSLFDNVRERGRLQEAAWKELRSAWQSRFPEKAGRYSFMGEAHAVPPGTLPEFTPGSRMATRMASKATLALLAQAIPALIGGSADLAPSCGTLLAEGEDFSQANHKGRNLHFGVREHAMGTILNGLALSGLIPYGATFLVFSDYMKPAIRLAALMRLRVIYLFSHDSIGLGEDGPTHQPIEQLAMLRATPGLTVIRPADANETSAAWIAALESKGPTALILSRQELPVLDTAPRHSMEGVARGAYVLADWQQEPERPEEAVLIIATGSEVHLALAARKLLEGEGIPLRVISMPSCERFEQQPCQWQEQVLPSAVGKRVVIEAASPFGWHRYAGPDGITIGINGFGSSAPGPRLMREYGFTPEHVAAAVRKLALPKQPPRTTP